MPIVSMSLSPQILKHFDAVTRRRGYPSRSEALREAMREFIDAAEWGSQDGENTLVLSILYEKEIPRGDLLALQHRFPEIRTMLHTHLDPVNCLELLVVEGPSPRLKDLIARVRRIKAVKQIKFMTAVANL
jgi:CopG family nickel-responsive transcriptional regulator